MPVPTKSLLSVHVEPAPHLLSS